MCGIIGGYTTRGGIVSLLVEGLGKEDYRGYDSAGVALMNGRLRVMKAVGKVENLEAAVRKEALDDYHFGIGHTRWATHGIVNEANAHPHVNTDGTIAVVHNGIIENYETLRAELKEKGYRFKTETDTEVVPHLIDYFLKETGDFEEAFRRTLGKLAGAYALAVVHEGDPRVYCAKFGSPLRIGFNPGDNSSVMLVSSEEPLPGRFAQQYILNDEMMAIISPEYPTGFEIKSFSGLKQEDILKGCESVSGDIQAVSKAGYPTFMEKEIHEQPRRVRDAIGGRLNHLETMALENFPGLKDRPVRRVVMACCGTSYHAALVGAHIIEKNARVMCHVEHASEFIYRDPVLDETDFFIAISQSGETKDTLAALKLAKERGCYIAGIVNTRGSSIAREAGKGLLMHAGPEIGVASTKAFTSTITALSVISAFLANKPEYTERLRQGFAELPSKLEQTLCRDADIAQVAQRLAGFGGPFFLGRGLNYPIALEGALKFKEISYRKSQGYPAGEMKHGPIAMIDEETPTVFILSGENSDFTKTLSNIREVKARKGKIIVITDNAKPIWGIPEFHLGQDFLIEVPKTIEELSPIVNVIPLQLLAYHAARFLGRDVDKPRNLAKSVTVE